MKLKKVELSNTIRDKRDLPPLSSPEIALIGRSNVGKSSLINVLVNRRKLAYTSGTPGKTRGVHFYNVNDQFFIVDLPGYGYARASQEQQRVWSDLVEAYLEQRKGHALLLQLVDLRHVPSADDLQMAAWIRHYALPYRVVATKADKVARGKRMKHRQLIATALQIPLAEILFFSATSGEGKEVLWGAILAALPKHAEYHRESITET
jgi:GTP-binding protein